MGCGDRSDQPDDQRNNKVDTTPVTPDEANTLALVDGIPISIAERTLYLQQRQQQSQTTDLNEITEELINLKVIVLNAEKEGLHQREDVKAELQRQRNAVLANVYIKEKMQGIEISDEALTTEYAKQLTQIPSKEYNASHILLENEAEALAVIDRLDGGEAFALLASEVSKGPSAKEGGSLGWFRLESMVDSFADALALLKKEEYTRQAVKTEFGWHVIRLNDTRPIERPTLEQVKDEVRTIVMNKRLNDLVQALRAKSTIEIR